MKMQLLVLGILTTCHVSQQGLTHLLAKKFVGAKLFKKFKALDQCEVIWENVKHPHCETSWHQQCDPVIRNECNTEYVEQCVWDTETKCRTEERQQCETKNIEFCETEAIQKCIENIEKMCKTEYVEECWEENEKDCKTSQECGTRQDRVCSYSKKWVCDKVEHPEPEAEPKSKSLHRLGRSPQAEPASRHKRGLHYFYESTVSRTEPEPESHYGSSYSYPETEPESEPRRFGKRSIDEDFISINEDEMLDRFENLPMRELLKLTEELTEGDIDEKEDEVLNQKLAKRSKRATFGHIAGALGISALYKKFLSTQEECRQIDVPDCAEVPIHSCWDVTKCQDKKVPKCRKIPQEVCWEEPKEKCWTEPHQTCRQEPKEKCWNIPEEICVEEPKQNCWKEPQENCFKVTDEQCKDVPQEVCDTVNVKVAKRRCQDDGSRSGSH